jgi:hypothetical protein
MPRFINLSAIKINVDAIRFILPGVAKEASAGEPSCTVCFLDACEPHVFYGEDAEKLLAFADKHSVSQEEAYISP